MGGDPGGSREELLREGAWRACKPGRQNWTAPKGPEEPWVVVWLEGTWTALEGPAPFRVLTYHVPCRSQLVYKRQRLLQN